MLPDYPKTKSRISTKIGEKIKFYRDQRLGFFAQIAFSLMQEGDKDIILRADGTNQEVIPKRHTATAILKGEPSKIEELTTSDFQRFMEDLGRQMADGTMKTMFETLEEECRKIGNVADPEKRGVEQFLELFEKRSFDFDEQGQLLPGELLVVSPDSSETIRKFMEEIERTPELRRRLHSIMDVKRREYLDREADRQLVD